MSGAGGRASFGGGSGTTLRLQASGVANTSAEPIELENQFLLRLPPEPAQAVRLALQSGAGNVKDRLKIQLEPEKSGAANHLRRGQVVFDGWTMSAKLKDLPTIIESQKTIDRKTFYKTADICQILVCKEGDQEDSDEGEAASPNKKVISCV